MFPLINSRETGINLRRIMNNRGITVKDIQQYLGLASVQSVYHWLNGLSMPTIDNLYALSELFQISIDAIVCGNRTPLSSKIASDISNPRERRMYMYYSKLNENRVA